MPSSSLLGSRLLRAFALGAGAAVGAAGAAWAIGIVPDGLASYLLGGVGAAIAAGGIAMWLNARFLATGPGAGGLPADGPILAARLQGLLAMAFAVKLAVVLIAVFAMQQAGVKFAATATFAVTFAAASLVCQLTSVGFLTRGGAMANPAANPAVTAAAKCGAGAADRIGSVTKS